MLKALFLFPGISLNAVSVFFTTNDQRALLQTCKEMHAKYPKHIARLDNVSSIEILQRYPNIQHVVFALHKESVLKRDTLPNTLKSLDFGDDFRGPISPGVLPKGIRKVRFGKCFRQDHFVNIFPESIRHLVFEADPSPYFHPKMLPSSLETLEFGRWFLGWLPKHLSEKWYPFFKQPQHLLIIRAFYEELRTTAALDFKDSPKHLRFLKFTRFNFRTIINLPVYLESIDFGMYQSDIQLEIDTFPRKLKSLKMNTFKCEIQKGFLPDSLHSLDFDLLKNQNLTPGVLPNLLRILTFGNQFTKTIDSGVLPYGLKELYFGSAFDTELKPDVLPSTLKVLVFGDSFNSFLTINSLPPNLETLIFGACFNCKLLPGVLPVKLKYLTFGTAWSQDLELGVFPDLLENLNFGHCFDKPLFVNVLPQNLKSLYFGGFNQTLHVGILPSKLKTLIFGPTFDRNIEPKVFPDTIEKLIFGSKFNKKIRNEVLPFSLKYLEFGENFNRKLPSLPQQLEYLILNDNYNKEFHSSCLPKSLISLRFGNLPECVFPLLYPWDLPTHTFVSFIKDGDVPLYPYQIK